MAPDGKGEESSPQIVSTSPASLKAWTWFFCSGPSFHSQHSPLCLEYLDQLRLFFVLLEADSQVHSGSQHLEHGIALHGRLFGA